METRGMGGRRYLQRRRSGWCLAIYLGAKCRDLGRLAVKFVGIPQGQSGLSAPDPARMDPGWIIVNPHRDTVDKQPNSCPSTPTIRLTPLPLP